MNATLILYGLSSIENQDSVEKTIDVLIEHGMIAPTFKDDLVIEHRRIEDIDLEGFFK
jgi:hypothetical protein